MSLCKCSCKCSEQGTHQVTRWTLSRLQNQGSVVNLLVASAMCSVGDIISTCKTSPGLALSPGPHSE
jgi:hypothetical protein